MNRSKNLAVGLLTALTLWASPALAHFGLAIPSEDAVLDKAKDTVDLTLSFSHPMSRKSRSRMRHRAAWAERRSRLSLAET